ncbi:MAG: hypothetical protein KIG95_10010 [Comamonas sp.]|nr:hypothetical protein [Comamonas sp.]
MHRIASFLLWAGAAALATTLWLGSPSAQLPNVAQPPQAVGANHALPDVQRVLQAGGAAAQVAAPRRSAPAPVPAPELVQGWRLLGIVHASAAQTSHALLQQGTQPPRALRVGEHLADGLEIVAITAREVRISTPTGSQRLVLPAP